uniref:serine O-acetyltransferase n=1 Tax=Ditylum brightwellii TaxID=49249 RepID=A0A7S4RF79_9STRA
MTRRRTKSPCQKCITLLFLIVIVSSLEYATYVQSFAVPVISSNSFGGAPPPFLQRRRRRRKGMYHSVPNMSSSSSNNSSSSNKVAAAWEDLSLEMQTKVYISSLLHDMSHDNLQEFLGKLNASSKSYTEEPGRSSRINRRTKIDPLWIQIKLEAQHTLEPEPEAGPQLYQYILSQPSLIDAIATIISNEISTELMPATALRCLFLDMLREEDDYSIHFDVLAAVHRGNKHDKTKALSAVLFNQGLHAMVCYRVGHRLWQANRTGLAYYMQSTVSSKYSADIHPAAKLGAGIYLNCGCGVVIGETAVVGDNTSILQGVTLGGTGKEAGDRHPKVGKHVILYDSVSVLGNIQIGDGAIVNAKSIVTKPVPPMAIVSGIPAKIESERSFPEEEEGHSSDVLDDNDRNEDDTIITSGSVDGKKKTKEIEKVEQLIMRLSREQWKNSVAR